MRPTIRVKSAMGVVPGVKNDENDVNVYTKRTQSAVSQSRKRNRMKEIKAILLVNAPSLSFYLVSTLRLPYLSLSYVI